jgi:hypothetical protein
MKFKSCLLFVLPHPNISRHLFIVFLLHKYLVYVIVVVIIDIGYLRCLHYRNWLLLYDLLSLIWHLLVLQVHSPILRVASLPLRISHVSILLLLEGYIVQVSIVLEGRFPKLAG